MEYSDLEKLKAEAYLNPENFVTKFDTLNASSEKATAAEWAIKRYEDGLAIGKEWGIINITNRSIWQATTTEGGSLTSSEGIGYHRNTKELLQGFIDSGAEINVKRFDGQYFTTTRIQESRVSMHKDYQQEEINKLREEFGNDIKTIKLISTKNGFSINSDTIISTQGDLKNPDIDKISMNVYASKTDNTYFIAGNGDIQNKIISKELRKVAAKLEDGIQIGFMKEDDVAKKIGYLDRTKKQSFEIEGQNVTLYLQSKSHHDDIQVGYFTKEKINQPTPKEISTKNNLSIK